MFNLRTTLLMLAGICGAPASAPQGSHELPVDYRCDKLSLKRLPGGGHELRCMGAAIFRRDDAVLCCDEAVGRADAHWKWQMGSCKGEVRLYRGDDQIWADRAEFSLARGELTLSGRPLLQRGGSRMTGEKMVVTPKSEEAQIEGPKGSIWLPTATTNPPRPARPPWLDGPLPERCPLPLRAQAP